MKKLLLFISLIWTCNVLAQFGPQQIISTNAYGARAVFVVDLDGDNLKDVISANKFDNSILWFKNIDGSSFSSQNFIASLSETINVHAADLDGDGDMDVLAVAPFLDLVVWYENLDGLGNFGTQNIIGSSIDGAYTVIAADIDGDGDMDVISGSDSSGIAWYKNLDGNGNFGSPQEVNFSSPNTRSLAAVDIDGDTDLDIVSSSSGSVTVSWYENLNGQGGFGLQRIIAGAASTVQSIATSDLDGDNDMDIIAATNGENKVAWFENLNGLGTFSTEIVITTNAEGARSVFAADLDNDNDKDILSASTFDHKIAWYENEDGQGNFGIQQIISIETNGVPTVFAADVDNDNDMDVFSTSEADHKVAWYENLTILGVEENYDDNLDLYPNPINDTLNITAKETINFVSISNVLGQVIYNSNIDVLEATIDMSSYANGTYFVSVTVGNNVTIKKFIKE